MLLSCGNSPRIVVIINQFSQVDVPLDAGLKCHAGNLFAKPPQVIRRQPQHSAGLLNADDLRQHNVLHFCGYNFRSHNRIHFHAPLVITGLHHMSNAIDMQLIADFGGTMLWPMIALSNIAQGSAVLGMIYLQRKNAAAQEVNVPACISCYLGVTEPAMFGVNLKYNFPFICGMIGSATAAVVCVATSTTANAIGVGGIPGILSIQPTYMLSFALCMLIAIVVPFVLTVAIGKKKGVA